MELKIALLGALSSKILGHIATRFSDYEIPIHSIIINSKVSKRKNE
jgi:hypothetical protein